MKKIYLFVLIYLFCVLTRLIGQGSAQLNQGLISYWRMDETSGSMVFDAAGNNHCTVQNGVTLNQGGLVSKSAAFISTSGGLTTGKSASALGIGGGASKSVSIWIKPDPSINGYESPGIIDLGNHADQCQFGIKYYGSEAYWMFDSWYGAVRIGPDNNDLADGLWHHIVVTYNQATHAVRTYLDGNFVTEDNSKVLNTGDDNGFSIGIGSQGNYPGLIDEVGLWNRPLGDEEVISLYNNGQGLVYPFPFPFQCGTPLYDPRNDRTYPTVNIGIRCWMAANLDLGIKISGAQNQADNGIVEKFCYNNLDANCNLYGGLYQWYEMVQYNAVGDQGLCPSGWHIPDEADFINMAAWLGGIDSAGGKIKEAGTLHWSSPNTAANNQSGFTALPGGYMDGFSTFSGQGDFGAFWTLASTCNVSGIAFHAAHNSPVLFSNEHSLLNAFAVRCVYDSCMDMTNRSLQIESSDTTICLGTVVTFTAIPTGGGDSPSYQWFKNSLPQSGATNLTYTFIPSSHDTVWCRMTSVSACQANPVVVESGWIVMEVGAMVIPEIWIHASDNPFCPGTMVHFYADFMNGGINPQFQWQVNGQDYEGATEPQFAYFPFHGDQVSCKLFSDEPCPLISPVLSDTISLESFSIIMQPLGPISGQSIFCASEAYPAVMYEYRVDPMPGAQEYYWFITRNGVVEETIYSVEPFITRPAPTSTYLLTVGNAYYCGIMSIYHSELLVQVIDIQPTITGPDSVTLNQAYTYTTEPGMMNYQWTVSPGGQMIDGGGSTHDFITIMWNSAGLQSISVNYSDINNCTSDIPTIDTIMVNLPSHSPANAGVTKFDVQTNAAGQNRLHLFPDGTIGATYMFGNQSSSFPDRGTGYRYFNGIAWDSAAPGRIEAERTGWPSYSPFGANGELVVTHTNDNPTALLVAKRLTKGAGAWSFNKIQGPSSNVGVLYPRAVTNGSVNENIHIIALTTPGPYGGYLVYNRSLDAGVTWSGWQILPGTDSSQYSGFSADAISFAPPRGDTLCFTSGTNWCDQILMKSTNNGATWVKTVIWPSLYNMVTSPPPADTFYCADKSNAVVLDNEGTAHVVFGRNKIKANGTIAGTSISDGLIYWNENMPQLPQSLDSSLLRAGGNWLANIPDPSILSSTSAIPNYGLSLTSMPALVADNEHIYVAWSSVTNIADVNGKKLRHIFAKASNNRGISWCSNTIDLCDTPQLSSRECVYPDFSSGSGSNELYLIFQQDSLAGARVNNSGQTVYDNNYIQFQPVLKSSFVYETPPVAAGEITGPTTPCKLSVQTYSVMYQPGVSFNWSLPPGWFQWEGGNTNAITVFVGEPGLIQVVPVNNCGYGSAGSLPVEPVCPPDPAGPISGRSKFCGGLSTMQYIEYEYSIAPVPRATSYEWFKDGVLLTESNTTIISLPGPVNSYVLSVRGVNVCGAGDPSFLNIELITVIPSLTGPDTACTGAALTFSTDPGMSDYRWIVSGGGEILSGGGTLDHEITVRWSLGGNYFVYIEYKDTSGCYTALPTYHYITIHPQMELFIDSISNPSCFNTPDGMVAISVEGGAPPFLYNWSNGATTQDIAGLDPGPYSVTITDANLCTITNEWTLIAPQEIFWAGLPQNATCYGNNDGSITTIEVTGGVPPYNFSWQGPYGFMSTDMNISGLYSGTYYVTVNDVNGCYFSGYVMIDEPEFLGISPEAVLIMPSCYGYCDGSIFNIMVFGGTAPFAYEWSNGQTTPDATGLCAGTYTLTVTDINGCQAMSIFGIGEPDPITVTGMADDVSCATSCDGSIFTIASGGLGAYTYQWSNGANTANLTDICSGFYHVIVTDVEGCEWSGSWHVGAPLPLDSYADIIEPTCSEVCDGSIVISLYGGTPPYSFLWEDGSWSSVRNGLCGGFYSVTVTDNNGCQLFESMSLEEPLAMTNSCTAVNPSCESVCDGEILINSVSGGTAPYFYIWSNGNTSSGISGLCSGGYELTITDARGCQISEVFTLVSELMMPVSVNIVASANPVPALTPVTFTATPVNGGSNPLFQWKVNGNIVGATNSTYTYIPQNGDILTCVMTSTLTCVSGNPATSNSIVMTIGTGSCQGVPTVSYGGSIYHTVEIGNQCWLRENLNVGQRISNSIYQSNNTTLEKYCYDNSEANCDIYGGLYQWNEMMNYQSSSGSNPSNRQGICPEGWHIPSDNEWCEMEEFVDSSVQCVNIGFRGQNIGGKLKEPGTSHWSSPNSGATNISNFSALPAGCNAGEFIQLHEYTYFWTSTQFSGQQSWMRYLGYNSEQSFRHYNYPKFYAFSVTCIKDTELPINQTNLNQNITPGVNSCFNATNTITVGGNNCSFMVLPGGSATLIAGQNILFYPGTSVQSSGYLHGYISPGGPWCTTPAMPAVMESTPEPGLPDSWNFRLYPNPTSAAFTLELAREPDGNPVRFEIYNLMGEIVQKDEFHSGRIHDYSLGNCKPGIYMVRVSQNGITGTGKIIRQ